MSEPNEQDIQAFEEDLQLLVETLQKSFESSEAQYFLDEQNEILYIRLEGLDQYTDKEIEEIAMPVLNTLDLDFEEIQLLPL